jgi:manganese-dependent ADP-ribose/CDP-alcohol diphosphatase
MGRKCKTLQILCFLAGLSLPGVWSSLPVQAQYSMRFLSPGTYLFHENCDELQLSEYTLECRLCLNDTGVAVQADTTGSWIIPVIARGFRENTSGAGLNYLFGYRKEDSVLYTIYEETLPPGFPRRYFSLAGYTPLLNNKWYHVAVTFDGAYLSLYLNGNLESRIESDFPPLSSSMNDLTIGTAMDVGGSAHGYFNGNVDNIRIWNHALSQTELRQLLNSEIQEPHPGLVLGAGCDEGEGKILQAQGLLAMLTLVGDDYEWQTYTAQPMLIPPDCDCQPLFKIGLIADPQYCDQDPSGTRYYRESLGKLEAAVDTLNARKVDFVVTLGDFIDHNSASFDSVLQRYARLAMPDYKVLGNHEFLVPDSIIPGVVTKLGMPGYYYDFRYKNWHFLVLFSMELSEFTGMLQPELAEEADSMWQRIQGSVNAYTWNGGISRSQIAWMRLNLSESLEKSEQVILFCHHPVFPYNNWNNLWNDTTVVSLITQFPNVVAFINGHDHCGSFGFHQGVQFFTHRAMVESQSSNSFSVLSVYPDRIEIDGQGMSRDRTWSYDRMDTLAWSISISNHTLDTRDTAGTFIGEVSLRSSVDTTCHKASFQLAGEPGCNRFFALSGDSLIMNTNENLSDKGPLWVHLLAMNCLKQMIYDSLLLVFDTVTIRISDPLPDTVVDVNQKSLMLPLEKVFTDLTRHGYSLSAWSGDPDKALAFTEGGNLICYPYRIGMTPVYVTACDTFTGFQVTDTFELRIARLYNKPPYITGTIDAVILRIGRDTLCFKPDTLFRDPDGDTLSYSLYAGHPEVVSIMLDHNRVCIIPVKRGETDVTLTAEDHFGGSAQLGFHVESEEDTLVNAIIPAVQEFSGWYDPLSGVLVIVAPENKKSVQVTLTEISGHHTGMLLNGDLPAGTTCFYLDCGHYPPGIYILSLMEGKRILHSQKIPVAY